VIHLKTNFFSLILILLLHIQRKEYAHLHGTLGTMPTIHSYSYVRIITWVHNMFPYTAFLTVTVLITRRQLVFAFSHQQSLWIANVKHGSEPKFRRNFVTPSSAKAYKLTSQATACSLNSRVAKRGMVIVWFSAFPRYLVSIVLGYLVPHISRHLSILIFRRSNCPRRIFKQKASFSAF
jgi:hypothetical protein